LGSWSARENTEPNRSRRRFPFPNFPLFFMGSAAHLVQSSRKCLQIW
jgi:hypothetical protein